MSQVILYGIAVIALSIEMTLFSRQRRAAYAGQRQSVFGRLRVR